MSDEDILERFEERAGICEHEGKMSRAEAEALAIVEVEKIFGRVPAEVLERYRKTIVVMKEFT